MTYNVFGGTLSLTQAINQSITDETITHVYLVAALHQGAPGQMTWLEYPPP